MGKVLNFDEIDALLKKEKAPQEGDGRQFVTPQVGPLRWYDTTLRCASRGCSSATYCKVSGIAYCMTHALRKLNEMLVEKGVEA